MYVAPAELEAAGHEPSVSHPEARLRPPFDALRLRYALTPLAGDVTRRTCSLNHSQTHDQIV